MQGLHISSPPVAQRLSRGKLTPRQIPDVPNTSSEPKPQVSQIPSSSPWRERAGERTVGFLRGG